MDRLFGFKNCPDVCVGVEPDYYSAELVNSVIGFCRSLGLSTEIDYPYRGSLVPNRYFGHRNTGIVSIMLEINKRVLL